MKGICQIWLASDEILIKLAVCRNGRADLRLIADHETVADFPKIKADDSGRIEVKHDTMSAAGRDFDTYKLHGQSVRLNEVILQAR